MGFTKLDSGIVNSSVWAEPLATRVVWVTMLAIADKNGYVPCARSGLLRASNVPIEDFDKAILSLESPDPDSRTPDNQGRRVEKVDGGWIILNFPKYRLHSEIIKDQTRIRVNKYREKIKKVTQCNVTSMLPSVSDSASVSASVSASEEIGKTERKESVHPFDQFWTLYPKKVGKGAAIAKWKRIPKPAETLELIKKTLEWQIKSEQWTKENGQYIPNPSTYLNQTRWLDEKGANNGNRSSDSERTVYPESN
jgi:hypothetical protein